MLHQYQHTPRQQAILNFAELRNVRELLLFSKNPQKRKNTRKTQKTLRATLFSKNPKKHKNVKI